MKLRDKKSQAIGFAVLAAALYAINAPVSKLLLSKVSATMMAAFLLYRKVLTLGLLDMKSARKLAGTTSKR